MPNRSLLALLATALMAGAFAAHAQDKKPQPQPAGKKEVNVAMCTGCHGIPGYKTAYPEVYHVPKIAGQQQAYLVNALKAYKSGERSHQSMRGIAASLTEEDMTALAAYYGAPAK